MVIKSIGSFDYSPIESKSLDLKVYRGVLYDINSEEILSTILEENIDLAIIRIPAERQDFLSRFQEIGIPHLIADTLVYYHVDLKKHEPGEPCNNDLEFIEFCHEHFEIIDRLVSEIFIGYKNHYTSNPLLSVDLIKAYKEWARSYVTNESKGRCGWLVKRGERFIGFATCAHEGEECEIVLNGVMPSAAGAGVYSDLIKFIQRFFKDRSYSIMKVSTQINNLRVQKVWNRVGFIMEKAFLTLHINCFMSVSRVEKKIFNVGISADDIARYSRMSGDRNRLQFDEGYARSKGFDGRVANEFLINAIISKHYGTEFPGDGTILIRYSSKFLKPVYLNKQYRVEISFPFIDSEKGIYKSLVKMLDSNNHTCAFSYIDLIKK